MTANANNLTTLERVSDTELEITRMFRARPQTLYAAMTDPQHVKRWWAPQSLGVVMHSIEADIRVGGRYRYVFGRPGDPQMAFTGVYRELVPGERVVYTQAFEQMPGAGDAVITATYREVPGGTLLVQRETYPSKDVCDGVLASGMETGMRDSMEQLAALVPTLE